MNTTDRSLAIFIMLSLKTSRTDFLSRVSFQCSGSDCFSGPDSSAFLFQKSDSVQFENSQGGIARKSSGVKITVLLCFLLTERDKMKEENG